MNHALEIVGIAVVTLAAGFAVGRLTAPDEPAAGSAADEPRAADLQARVALPPTQVPARVDPPTPIRCQDAEVELRFLKAGRELRQAREQEIRRTFADGTELEDPMRWMALAEKVVAECLPASLEPSFMECTEYPCIAALASPSATTPEAREELEYLASEALESCAPLVEAFGEGYPLDAAMFLSFPVSCPSGDDEEAWVMLLLDPKGDAFYDIRADPDDRLEAARVNRWIYRRAHDVDRKWICEGEVETP